jgi:acyl-coenzyme A synthetase/AMP-(fatty) acid ligase
VSQTLDAFLEAARAAGARPAIVDGGDVVSFADLARAIDTGKASPGPSVAAVSGRACALVVESFRLRRDGRIPALGGGAPESDAAPAGTAFLRATSGSTGVPRWICFDEAAALAAARRSAALLGLTPGQALVTTVGAATSYGWVAGLLGPLVTGATVVVAPPESPRDLVAVVERHAAAWVVTTPPVVRALARLAAKDGAARLGARVLVGASAYPEDAVRRLLDAGVEVVNRYGASEAGPIAQAPAPLHALRPAPGVDVALRDGRLEVRCDAVALGVVGGARFGGVFQTEDRAELEANGGFRLLDRADRVVRRAGRSVSLERVEDVLRAQPEVSGARVAAEQDRAGALELDLVARVTLLPGAQVEPDALLSRIAPELQPWERPRRVVVVEREGMEKW